MVETVPGRLQTLATGFAFTECPRWHDNKLYFSDILGHDVYRSDLTGNVEKLATLPDDEPSGLGFMPNGDLLIVAMHTNKVYRLNKSGKLTLHADVSSVAPKGINDMVVDKEGRAYVVQFGFNFPAGEEMCASPLVGVDPDGRVYAATTHKLMVANGITITEDGRTLICAESGSRSLSAFDRDPATGGLSNHRYVIEKLRKGEIPDGICLDNEGGIWASCCFGPGVVRYEEGKGPTHIVTLPEGRYAYACMFGGADKSTLYICTADQYNPPGLRASRTSSIDFIETKFTGAGLP